MSSLAYEKVWTDRQIYEEAERKYYESSSKATLTPLADEVAKARQRLIQFRDNLDATDVVPSVDTNAVAFLEKKFLDFQKVVSNFQEQLNKFDARLTSIEKSFHQRARTSSLNLDEVPKSHAKAVDKEEEDDDDVDLFGSESEEESESAARLRKERLAAYEAKKSKKPTLIAKSSIILDVKPWDDTTDMKLMEERVRQIQMDGLLWGASKLVSLAYGIHKLQINCVIEDDKVSVDLLQELIQEIEDLVQSVDIAAFNKI